MFCRTRSQQKLDPVPYRRPQGWSPSQSSSSSSTMMGDSPAPQVRSRGGNNCVCGYLGPAFFWDPTRGKNVGECFLKSLFSFLWGFLPLPTSRERSGWWFCVVGIGPKKRASCDEDNGFFSSSHDASAILLRCCRPFLYKVLRPAVFPPRVAPWLVPNACMRTYVNLFICPSLGTR